MESDSSLTLAQALRLTPLRIQNSEFRIPNAVAFVGAGGKTSAMFQLARDLPPPVIITTTTHLGAWQTSLADEHVIVNAAERPSNFAPRGVTLVTAPAAEDRLPAPAPDVLLWLREYAQGAGIPLLVEADGSRQKPLKSPDSHEPPIPVFSDLVVAVAGLSGLHKRLSDESVHRVAQFAALSGLREGDLVSPEALVRVLLDRQAGGLKNVPVHARRVALLNQADTESLQAEAHSMAHDLLGAYDAVVVASLQGKTIHAVHERAAGVILAAGGSTRLGRPKQLLDWHGQPFVRAVARTALAGGLDPVIVVTGADADAVAGAVSGLPVTLAHNESWRSGQASSIRLGVQSLPASTGSAVFLLADQPQVTFDVIAALIDTHAAGLHAIVAPLVMMERRANPVLFDRSTFPDLLKLEGDVGGRAIFSKHRVEFMPWHDDRLLLDVDTEADYKRLVEDDTL